MDGVRGVLQHSRILPDPAPLLHISPTITVSVGFVWCKAKPELRPAESRDGKGVICFGFLKVRCQHAARG